MHGSRDDLPIAIAAEGVVIRLTAWGEMTVALETFPAGTDTAPIFTGLPDNQCQSPHWGFVLRGRVRVRYRDREEVMRAGDAFYLEPGHTTVFEEETELIEFSPLGDYQKTLEIAQRNVAARQESRTPA